MRHLLLLATFSLLGCVAEEGVQEKRRVVVVPDHSIEAFGGRLLGTNLGEWRGNLYFQDADGNVDDVLNENVHGIVENPEGIFVFTGLAHLTLNEGFLYIVDRDPTDRIVASRLGRLPGAPSRVHQSQPGGTTSFLVYSGLSNDRPLFECYQLSGKVVSRANDCLPPSRDMW